jgi:UDP-N-acetylglucosamine--N-acetylmuramyl-(pentapeptide) pyrophosphoryl-undecaprenol N-acetylglucosamine transferase
VVLVASLLGVRTVILEPNARPGFTNRVLRPFVARAACAYEPARSFFGPKGVLTGNPVRRGFASLPPKPHAMPMTLLAFGGSQGSRVLNRALMDAAGTLPGPERLLIVHQTGEAQRAEVAEAYARAGRPAEVTAFLDDMPRHFGEADLVLSRSGATTCAELLAAGKAAVLVPFAQAADDHQTTNARTLEAAGAAVVLEERALSGDSVAQAVGSLVGDPTRLQRMEDAARGLSRPDAAARVADLLEAREGSGGARA